MSSLPASVPLFKEYHALIVTLGKNLCLGRKPRCEGCPVRELCRAGRQENREKNEEENLI